MPTKASKKSVSPKSVKRVKKAVKKKKVQADKGTRAPRDFKLQVFLSPEWKKAVYDEAERRGMKVSQFARVALAEQMPPKVRKSLPDTQQGRRTDLE